MTMPDTLRWSALSPEQRNALIHEKVMGKRLTCGGTIEFSEHDVPSRAGGVAFTMTIWTCQRCGEVGSGKPPECHEKLVPLPSYTTDMNAAWLIVEHITNPPTSACEPYHSAGPRFALWFKTADLWASTGQEAAEMICLHALKCVGVHLDE